MKQIILARIMLIVVLGGIFSGCAKLDKALDAVDKIQTGYETSRLWLTKNQGKIKDFESKMNNFGATIEKAEAKSAILLKKYDKNGDGELSKEEMANPMLIMQVVEDVKTGGWCAIITILSLIMLFLGNHARNPLDKIKQYWLKGKKATGVLSSAVGALALSPEEEADILRKRADEIVKPDNST